VTVSRPVLSDAERRRQLSTARAVREGRALRRQAVEMREAGCILWHLCPIVREVRNEAEEESYLPELFVQRWMRKMRREISRNVNVKKEERNGFERSEAAEVKKSAYQKRREKKVAVWRSWQPARLYQSEVIAEAAALISLWRKAASAGGGRQHQHRSWPCGSLSLSRKPQLAAALAEKSELKENLSAWYSAQRS